MCVRFITLNLLSLNKRVPVILNRTLSSTSYDWKILGLGASKKTAAKATESMRSEGYKNAKVIGINNSEKSDQELAAALKEQQWDAVSIGGYVNGFDLTSPVVDENVPKDRDEILVWYNRVLNIVHEQAPKSKIILVKSPKDIPAGIQRVMQGENKQTQ